MSRCLPGTSEGTDLSMLLQLRAALNPFGSSTVRAEQLRSSLGPRKHSLGERERSSTERRSQQGFHKGGVLGGARPGQLASSSSNLSRTSSTDRLSPNRQGSEEEKQLLPGIECMDYSPRLHLIAAVLSDGRCAILRTGAFWKAPTVSRPTVNGSCGRR